MPKVCIKIHSGKVLQFEVEVAKTMAEREKGLMYRDYLKGGHGMFFIFEKPEVVNFWMKHTRIPLEIIFIDENLKIVHIEKYAEPCPEMAQNCPFYSSVSAIKYVLEIAAETVDSGDISEGDTVELI